MHSLVKAYGLLETHNDRTDGDGAPAYKLQLLRPIQAEVKDLIAYHDREYIEHILGSRTKSAPKHEVDSEYGLEEV